MRKFIAFGPALVVLLTALVTLFAAPAAVRMIGYASTEATIRLAQQTLDQDTVLRQLDRAVRAIADGVEPSVVHIGVREDSGSGGAGERRGERRGQGSGWIYDTAGHIVTNAHVVRDARQIMVQFQDGRTVEAEAVGLDSGTDVAILRVKSAEGIFPARRATGGELHQGERVYAFGSPFGFKFSMSEGIVSGLGRNPQEIIGQEGYTNFIQTDAAVNPGNSGGPLVNIDGRVVGMNVAIATGSNANGISEGQSSGISFAIPLATIESVADQLIASGRVTRGFLGIGYAQSDERNDALVADSGFRGRGVHVGTVPPDGPAARAGIRQGDIITSIGGVKTPTIAVLRSAITNNKPGDRVEVELWRSGETIRVTVPLAQLAESRRIDPEEAVRELTRGFGIGDFGEDEEGAFIAEVLPDSPAIKNGVAVGQRVVGVNGKAVTDKRAVMQALLVSLLVNRRDVTLTIEEAGGEKRDVIFGSP